MKTQAMRLRSDRWPREASWSACAAAPLSDWHRRVTSRACALSQTKHLLPSESAGAPAQSKTWRISGARNLFRFGLRAPQAIQNCRLSRRFETRSGLKSALLALCLLTFALCSPAFAQEFSIDWFTVDGGGSTSASTGGVFAVSGSTFGQPDAQAVPMLGGCFSDRKSVV